jgi:hypothetical protein
VYVCTHNRAQVRGEKSSDFNAIKPWQLFAITFYVTLWAVNVLAFLAAGIHLQQGALSLTNPRFLDTSGLEKESETVFVIV